MYAIFFNIFILVQDADVGQASKVHNSTLHESHNFSQISAITCSTKECYSIKYSYVVVGRILLLC